MLSRLDLITLNISGLSKLNWWLILSSWISWNSLRVSEAPRQEVSAITLFCQNSLCSLTMFSSFCGVHSASTEAILKADQTKNPEESKPESFHKSLKAVLKKWTYMKVAYVLKIDLPYQKLSNRNCCFHLKGRAMKDRWKFWATKYRCCFWQSPICLPLKS